MIVGWILAAIFFIMSILLICGKGSWLIAGYNTASKEEKEQYDKKKLCRAMGIFLLLITIATALLLTIEAEIMPLLYGTFLVLSLIVVVIYTNTKCKKDKT